MNKKKSIKKYTMLMGEKIWLKDILKIEKSYCSLAKLFDIKVSYVSDYFKTDSHPLFYIKKYYESERQRNRDLLKLAKSIADYWNFEKESL